MLTDEDAYAVLRSRDGRFDGRFFVAVVTTGIFCRPSCPAALPKRENVRFYPSSAAALEAGFRACKRCRPDTAPGSPEWNVRADVAGRAMRLIADGLVDREGVAGLASRLGYSERQLHRQLTADLGAGPQALARAQRAATARTLLETTDLPASEIAFAAGFSSIRQFNDTVRKVYGTTPTALRGAPSARRPPGALRLRLTYRPPLDLPALFSYLAARAIPGLEEATAHCYRRSLTLPHGLGLVTLRPAGTYVSCELHLADLRDLAAAVRRCRHLLDLDADPRDIADHLTRDPLLAAVVARTPGRRVPGHVDAAEMAIRAILNEETPAGRSLLVHLVRTYGTLLPHPPFHAAGVTHAFPRMEALASSDGPAPVTALARALTAGTLHLGPEADRDQVERELLTLPGLDAEAVARIRMRAFGDPDVFLPSDPAVREGLHRLGLTAGDARRWRPWRSYAMQHLSAPLTHTP
ncbi:DNA-3-methyladenine glycosylase 2 family protein [Nonomuraea jabiensis]|uniref:AraC family transcriptional regulator of adaptative response / DNA-3-methyladenine glycosylase II n=1 Tax=Nonomuraea jabiensis TaxID=882448 RepID=A0A7W9G2Q3_9ACTN|nr:AlkA N-terminal domain-containing protein [Nonomuraea jabiensis]MBB5776032.1 AraC family transcriptional regulator of adaptative response / DNA-3-methyladenine glycosylase II [Nonomuraea jabiensis]